MLPEITLPAPAAVPPTVVPVEPDAMATPPMPLGSAAVPARLVPIKFPWIEVSMLLWTTMPAAALPEMRLASPAFGPPICAPVS